MFSYGSLHTPQCFKVPLIGVCTERSEARNRAYYAKFPADADRVKRIIKYLTEKDIHLPDGSIFVPERLMSLGLGFGMHGEYRFIYH